MPTKEQANVEDSQPGKKVREAFPLYLIELLKPSG
jgi:hypothetical protein